HEEGINISGWVVNVVGAKPLYGVVRYFVGGEDRAWVESKTDFGQDLEAAKKWVKDTIAQLREEMKGEER
ncbi:MAG: hypothetical protein J2P36_25375, partial [Ktedonobacteraceae bacterium]|nr:hypothetical protein [Ktedonobacteraceae bacterium]